MTRLNLSRIERWIWYVFIGTVSWQTRLIVWQADARFIEWRAVSLYAGDVLMVALIVLALVRARGWFVRRMDTADWVLGFIFAFAVLSLAQSDHIVVGIYQLLRLAQGMLLYLYLRHWAWHQFNAERTVVALIVGALLQSTLGIAQYVLQHDAGLRWLGESVLQTNMRGVAVFFDAHGVKVLRAYGTFPHPNVLAAYLMMSLAATAWLWLRHGAADSRSKWVFAAAASIILWALYLTFARTVIALGFVASLAVLTPLYVHRLSGRWPHISVVRRRATAMIATVVVVSVWFAVMLWPTIVARMTISSSDEAVRLRVKYNEDAILSGSVSPWNINWTGVGIGNFTTWLSRYDPSMPSFMYQPAHNVYLMIYSETGALSVMLWLVWIALVLRTGWRAYESQPIVRLGVIGLVGVVLTVGLFDHFYWTLQQGRLLWWGALAMLAGRA